MPRPTHLPDYRDPPLIEVALGIQFRQPKGYHQLWAGEVWKLFKTEYPVVEEQQRLDPSFETFGPIIAQGPRIQFMQGAVHDRFWFLTPKGDGLVQFQSDRLLHNWRRQSGTGADYPRFESMVATLRGQAISLQAFFNSLETQALDINQCEATYINHFSTDESPDFKEIQDYLRIFNVRHEQPSDVGFQYRRTILDNGKPTGRLYCEAATAQTLTGKMVITLNLSVRGSPASPTIDSAMDFLGRGRELIVKEFTEITTDKAHTAWGRQN